MQGSSANNTRGLAVDPGDALPGTAATGPTASRSGDPGTDHVRLGGLSDALFAIVLTLLVLELRLPEVAALPAPGGLLTYFADLWPKLFSYFLTFMITAVYWLAHHRIVAHIERHDRRVLWLNLMFLLCVGLLPFPTALVGSYPDAFSWTVYSINMVAVGVTLTALWGYALAQGLTTPGLPRGYGRLLIARGLVTPGVFTLSAAVAWVSLPAAYLLLVLIMPVQRFFGREAAGSGAAARRALPQRGTLWWMLGFFPVALFVAWSLWVFVFYRAA